MNNTPLNHYPSRHRLHQAALNAALSDRDAARDEIFAWLQGLSPEERAKTPPEKYARLSPEQFAILLNRPDRPLPNLPKMSFDDVYAEPTVIGARYGFWEWMRPWFSAGKVDRRRSRKNRAFKIRSPFHQASRWAGIAGLCSGLASISAIVALPYISRLAPPPVRSMDVTTWPQCGRLTPETDGCVYFVESGMTWPEAANWLGMPLSLLLEANKSLSVNGAGSLAKNAPIIVWRFRQSLSR